MRPPLLDSALTARRDTARPGTARPDTARPGTARREPERRTADREPDHDMTAVRAWARSRGYPIDECSGVPLAVLRTYRQVHAG